jgi:hypothetical protein
MPESVRYRTTATHFGFSVRYAIETMEARIPMSRIVFSMLFPSCGVFIEAVAKYIYKIS